VPSINVPRLLGMADSLRGIAELDLRRNAMALIPAEQHGRRGRAFPVAITRTPRGREPRAATRDLLPKGCAGSVTVRFGLLKHWCAQPWRAAAP
jgi:hypothetical protein